MYTYTSLSLSLYIYICIDQGAYVLMASEYADQDLQARLAAARPIPRPVAGPPLERNVEMVIN